MKRKEFLKYFLGALGAIDIIYNEIRENYISGTAIYDKQDEQQDFIWHVSENDIPSDKVFKLAKLLYEKKLLDIDQITISRSELKDLFNKEYNINIDEKSFEVIINSLKGIEVKMIDEGKESDLFFIHE